MKLSQVIVSPTRVTTDSVILHDVVITNMPDTIIESDYFPCLITDHDLISITINLRKPKNHPIFITNRILRYYSPDLFSIMIENETIKLKCIFDTDDVIVLPLVPSECLGC